MSKAIAVYSLRIEHYCLSGLSSRCSVLLVQGGGDLNRESLLAPPADDTSRWRHERTLFINEGFGNRSLEENLKRLVELTRLDATAVAQSKRKDDLQGNWIMDDYATVHGTAANDPFVQQVKRNCEATVREIEKMIGRL